MARRRGTKPGNDQAIAARLHGAPRLVLDGGERPLERKTAGLLAYLAVRGESTRSTLAALLWPDSAPDAGRNNLRQALFKLKKAAGCDLVVGADALSLGAGLRCDLGERPRDEPLLGGCEYADCPEFLDWLTRERERLASRGIAALASEAERLEHNGDLDGALEAALLILRVAPLEEAQHRRAMRLHYLRGDRAASIAAFEHCSRVLRDELDAQPDEQTRSLAASIADGSAARPSIRAAVVPVTLLRPPRLVGRDGELRAMAKSWTEGRAFLLLGEAGLGKSRLIFEFARERRGVVASSARPGDPGIPYASLARLLRALIEPRAAIADSRVRGELARLLPELSEGAGMRGEARALQAAISALLRNAVARGVEGLILDDLHFADAASLEMANALAGEGSAIRWGFAQRPAEGAPQAGALRAALGEAWRLDSIALSPLDERQMAEFVESLHLPAVSARELAPRLVKLTGGNPLFALETLKAAVLSPDPGPDGKPLELPRPRSVEALIELRLSQLSPAALALARVAAVAGGDFDAEVAGLVLGEKPLALADPWRELEDAHVLAGDAFAHDLIHEATLRSVPAPIARHAHGVIAASLEARDGAPERIAEHWIAAGHGLRAVPFLRAAATKAEKSARFAESRAFIEQAIAIASAAGLPDETFELRFLLVELLKDIGEQKHILGIIDTMRADASSADQRLRLGRAEVQARYYMNQDFEGAMKAGTRLLEDEELRREASPQRLAELHYALADTLIGQRKPLEALRYLEPVEAEFAIHPDPQYRGWFHSDFGRVLLLADRPSEGEVHLEKALEMARIVGRNRMISGVLLVMAQAASVGGRLSEPVERIQEAQRLVADMDDSSYARACHCYATEYLLNQGRYREALDAAKRAEGGSIELTPAWKARHAAVQELMWAQLGDRHRARRFRALADREKIGGSLRAPVLAFRIEAHLVLGESIEPSAAEYAELIGELPDSARWRLAFWRARTAGTHACAAAEFAAIADRAGRAGLHGHAIEAHIAAMRLARDSRPAVAVEHAREALELLNRYTMPGGFRPSFWLACHGALASIDGGLAAKALRDGAKWVRTVARFHVPAELTDSFLANRVNRALLEAERAAGITLQ